MPFSFASLMLDHQFSFSGSADEHLCTKNVYQGRKKQVGNVNLSHLSYASIPLHGLDTSMTYEEAGAREGVNYK